MSATLSRLDGFLLLLLTVVWGANWPIMKLGVTEVHPYTFRTVTMIGGLAIFALVAWLQGHHLAIARRHWRETAVLSTTNMVVWYALSALGIQLLSSGRAAILGYTLPVWVALIGTVVYRERHGVRLLFALGSAAVGVGLLLASEFGAMTGRPLGTVCLLAAAAAWALGTHQLRRRVQKTPIVVLSFWMMAVTLAVCAVLAFVFERQHWNRWPSRAAWWAIGYNAVLAYGIAQLIWFRIAAALPPVVSALSVMMIPVIGVLAGQWMLGEQPGWTDYVALAAILVAIGATLLPRGGPAR